MNEQKKKKLEIAKKIVEQGNCDGYKCRRYTAFQPEPVCGLYSECGGWTKKAVNIARVYIKEHSKKISREDLLKRIEKLEAKVEEMEISSELHRCDGIEDALLLKKRLESDILSLVMEYEEKTGMKVSEVELKTGPFLFIDIFSEEQRNEAARKNHVVNVKVTL